MHNYSEINWADIFQYSEDSPTGLIDQKTGRSIGTLRFNKDGSKINIEVYKKQKCFIASRIIWVMHHGPLCESMQIDHIDGNPHNNRIENLRCVTPLKNSRNMARKAGVVNPTGVTGVFYQKIENKNGSTREYYIAKVGIGTCNVSRYFNIGKLGKEEAFRKAVAFRMQHLNESNFYTERHGIEIRQ